MDRTITKLEQCQTPYMENIFNMSFITIRDTKIQTFQYKIIHNIIPCNQWLYNIIKIKVKNKCTFCNDNLPYFFLNVIKSNNFGLTGSTGGKKSVAYKYNWITMSQTKYIQTGE